MTATHVFLDERDGAAEAAGFLAVTAVFVAEEQLAPTRARAEAIRRRLFGDGPMTTAGAAWDGDRTLALLGALAELDLRTYTLAIQERELQREGALANRAAFVGHLQRRLYERIYRPFETVAVWAPAGGGETFVHPFERHVAHALRPDLFARRSFTFAPREDDPLLQIPDVVSGTLAAALGSGKPAARVRPVLELVARRSVGIEVWPPLPIPEAGQYLDETRHGRHDELVRRHCLRQARLFLERTGPGALVGADETLRAQRELLELLLFQVQFVDDAAFVPAERILERLAAGSGIRMSVHQLRSAVVSRLRDADVIIASSPKGYKLPVSEADMREFVAQANTMVPPMLARLRRAREELKVASLGALDILEARQFEQLRRLVEASQGGAPWG